MVKTCLALLVLSVLGGAACGQSAPNTAEAAMVKAVDASMAGDLVLLERLVNINSGTMDGGSGEGEGRD